MHETALIETLVSGVVLAFAFGLLAQRLRVPPLVGYLVAGWLVGPHSPGFVADQGIAAELAELGIILLMFGVGLHFSVRDLLAVRKLAIPGALLQITVATAMGAGLGWALGWPLAAGLLFGLALSVASTVVLLRAIQQLRLLESERGRIAVGWLIVEDLVMVLALVLIPALAAAEGGANFRLDREILATLALTVGKVAAFAAVMFVIGRRAIPWLLERAASSGSRELFRLSVLAIAMGVALGAAELFGISFALGAFFAGMVLAESDLSHEAAEESLPLRDAFAVLFFVSAGMLFNPRILIEQPLAVLAAIGIVVVGKSLVAYALVRAFGYNTRTALTISVSLAQVGEFSFILVNLGGALELIPPEAGDLVIAAAIVSICLNPLLFRLVPRHRTPATQPPPGPPHPTQQRDHTVVVGYGRVGSRLAGDLRALGKPFVVIDDRAKPARAAAQDGIELIFGNSTDPAVLGAANVPQARELLVALPQAYEAGQTIRLARDLNPAIPIVTRADSEAEIDYLTKCGATATVLSEHEIARGLLDAALAAATPFAEVASDPITPESAIGEQPLASTTPTPDATEKNK